MGALWLLLASSCVDGVDGSPSRGFLLVSDRADEALVSAGRLRGAMPEARIALVCDGPTAAVVGFVENASELFESIDVPRTWAAGSDVALALALSRTPFERVASFGGVGRRRWP